MGKGIGEKADGKDRSSESRSQVLGCILTASFSGSRYRALWAITSCGLIFKSCGTAEERVG